MPETTGRPLTPLKQKFGERLIFNTESLPDYLRDASEIKELPAAIFFAESENDVMEAVRHCHAAQIPVVFRGAGTGYTGGAVPVAGGLVLSLERLKKLEIDSQRKSALCGPGVITLDLMKAAERRGLFYPPDPASYDESTLGGNVAECAGGLHCKKYGVTKDYVIGLRGVTSDGRIITTGIYADNELFYLEGALIGSEGLLVAITEIAFRLIDLPEKGQTIMAAFENPEDAAQAISEITRCGIIPSVMEYMDGGAVACSVDYEKVEGLEKAAALVLFETTGIDAAEQSERIRRICGQFHAGVVRSETDPARAETLWKIRRNLSKAVKASAVRKISEDVCVPPSQLAALVTFVSRLNDEYPVRINAYGHAGDGNLHVNFLAAGETEDEARLIDQGVRRLFDKTLELGGTLTGEHGIGLTKKSFLPLEFDSATIGAMQKIKRVFDPTGILNPGKMFS